MSIAIADPSKFVMKPQREGGGHNLFGEELRIALTTMSRQQRAAYILMQRIFPAVQTSALVRAPHPRVCLCERASLHVGLHKVGVCPLDSPSRADVPVRVVMHASASIMGPNLEGANSEGDLEP